MSKTPEQHAPEVYTITDAYESSSVDQGRRMRTYGIMMGVRTLCIVLAVLTPQPWLWVFIAGAVFLPYIAVVNANNSARAHTTFNGPGAGPAKRAIGA